LRQKAAPLDRFAVSLVDHLAPGKKSSIPHRSDLDCCIAVALGNRPVEIGLEG
jgi:hypothetical protein